MSPLASIIYTNLGLTLYNIYFRHYNEKFNIEVELG
jgi:hypothetical protein